MTTQEEQPTQVLFVCVHNVGRSQMAAALLKRYAGNRVAVRSAGTMPADEINPTVVAAMSEIGIDITNEVPRALGNDAFDASDVVITMGCGDTCPIFPSKRYLDWELEDPAGGRSTKCAPSATRSTERFAHSYATFSRRLSSRRSQHSAKRASLDRLMGDRGRFAPRQ